MESAAEFVGPPCTARGSSQAICVAGWLRSQTPKAPRRRCVWRFAVAPPCAFGFGRQVGSSIMWRGRGRGMPRVVGVTALRQLPVVRRETRHPSTLRVNPRVRYAPASGKEIVSLLCRGQRRRRAGRGCSATIPGQPSPHLAGSLRPAYAGAEPMPSLVVWGGDTCAPRSNASPPRR